MLSCACELELILAILAPPDSNLSGGALPRNNRWRPSYRQVGGIAKTALASTSIIHNVELKAELHSHLLRQRYHDTGFLRMENRPSIGNDSAVGDRERFILGGAGATGGFPAKLPGAQFLALDPCPDRNDLGIHFGFEGTRGLCLAGEFIAILAQDPFEKQVRHISIGRGESARVSRLVLEQMMAEAGTINVPHDA